MPENLTASTLNPGTVSTTEKSRIDSSTKNTSPSDTADTTEMNVDEMEKEERPTTSTTTASRPTGDDIMEGVETSGGGEGVDRDTLDDRPHQSLTTSLRSEEDNKDGHDAAGSNAAASTLLGNPASSSSRSISQSIPVTVETAASASSNDTTPADAHRGQSHQAILQLGPEQRSGPSVASSSSAINPAASAAGQAAGAATLDNLRPPCRADFKLGVKSAPRRTTTATTSATIASVSRVRPAVQVATRDVSNSSHMASTSETASATPATADSAKTAKPVAVPAATVARNEVVTAVSGVGKTRKSSRPSPRTTQSTIAAPPVIETSAAVAAVAAVEEEVKKQRAPLVDRYGPYISESDTSLAAARQRLHQAIAQTQILRTAFTERIYNRYRVCLWPPPSTEQIIASCTNDASATYERLTHEINSIKEEKDIEKREYTKINNELSTPTSASIFESLNIDSAEQLMLMTTGLNLVILPEQELPDPDLVERYPHRSPIDPETGQRFKHMSQAVATAAEVTLERTRKAVAMRMERQRRWRLQLLSGEDPEDDGGMSYSQLLSPDSESALPGTSSLFASAPTTSEAATATASATGKSVKPRPDSLKAIRSRGQSGLTTAIQLSLNPSAEEVQKPDGDKCAATAALIARGLGALASSSSNKTTQLRLRHPHPDSLGGRRRASMNPSAAKKEASGLWQPNAPPERPFLQAYLALTLPPLPAAKERLERKKVAVFPVGEAPCGEAHESVESILRNFTTTDAKNTDESQVPGRTLGSISNIRLLNTIRKLSNAAAETKKDGRVIPPSPKTDPSNSLRTLGQEKAVPASGSSSLDSENSTVSRKIDPLLTFSVLHSLGLFTHPDQNKSSLDELLSFPPKNDTWSRKLTSLQGIIQKRGKRSWAETSLSETNYRLTPAEQGPERSTGPPTKMARVDRADFMKQVQTAFQGNTLLAGKRSRTDTADAEAESSASSQDKKARLSDEDNATSAVEVERIRGSGNSLPDEQSDSIGDLNGNDMNCCSDDQNDSNPTPESERGARNRNADDPPVLSIRGGGEVLLESSDDPDKKEAGVEDKKKADQSGQRQPASINGSRMRPRSLSSPGRSVTDGSGPDAQGVPSQSQGRGTGTATVAQRTSQSGAPSMGSSEAYNNSTLNTLNLANQLRRMQHPAGDLAGYLGSLNQQQQLSNLVAATSQGGMTGAQSSLAALGIAQSNPGIVGFSAQDQATAAAMYARDHQTAAILGTGSTNPGCLQPSTTATFGTQAQAVAALLHSGNRSGVLGQGQYPSGIAAGTASVPNPLAQLPRQPSLQTTGGDETKLKATGPRGARSRSTSEDSIGRSSVKRKAPPASKAVHASSDYDGEKKPAAKTIVSLEGDDESQSVTEKDGIDTSSVEIVDLGMKYVAPKIPPAVTSEHAFLIRSGRFGEVAPSLEDSPSGIAAIEYLVSVGRRYSDT